MNINHTFQYLQMGLPERINRKKLFGDFEGALQDMESYLLTPDLPDAMRHCLTTEAEMLRRLSFSCFLCQIRTVLVYNSANSFPILLIFHIPERKPLPLPGKKFLIFRRKNLISWNGSFGSAGSIRMEKSGILTGSLKIYAGPIRRWPDGPEKRPLLEMDGIFRKR